MLQSDIKKETDMQVEILTSESQASTKLLLKDPSTSFLSKSLVKSYGWVKVNLFTFHVNKYSRLPLSAAQQQEVKPI